MMTSLHWKYSHSFIFSLWLTVKVCKIGWPVVVYETSLMSPCYDCLSPLLPNSQDENPFPVPCYLEVRLWEMIWSWGWSLHEWDSCCITETTETPCPLFPYEDTEASSHQMPNLLDLRLHSLQKTEKYISTIYKPPPRIQNVIHIPQLWELDIKLITMKHCSELANEKHSSAPPEGKDECHSTHFPPFPSFPLAFVSETVITKWHRRGGLKQ